MRGKLVTIFGGNGFVGSYLIPKLIELGALVRVAVRDIDHADNLKISGQVGMLEIVVVNLHDEKSVEGAIGDSDYVVNMIGILFESRRSTFEFVHAQVPKIIAHAAAKRKVGKFVQVSAIGADPKSISLYSASKGRGENAVLKAFPNATILRPSVLFGAEDNFFNMFAAMAVKSPFLPLIAGGKMKMQPAYVGDVAEAICRVLMESPEGGNPHAGKIYELGGPVTYTFRQLMELVLKLTGRNRMLMSIPYPVALVMGSIMQIFPSPVLTKDQVKLIKSDNVVSPEALTFKNLDIEPTALESVVPEYLKRFRLHR